MKDFFNETRLTGTIHRLRPVTAKGTSEPMAEVIMDVGTEQFRVFICGQPGNHILADCQPGDRVRVLGRLTVQKQQDPSTGTWRHNHAVRCWKAEKLGR